MSQNPSKQEIDDLAEMQARLNKIARDAMDAMRHGATADATHLKHCGHKTNADAVLSSYKYYAKGMDDVIRAHIKKYPD